MRTVDLPPANHRPGLSTATQLDADTFRLIVESVLDYAIFMLDPDGPHRELERGAAAHQGVYAPTRSSARHFSTFYTADAIERSWPAFELKEAVRVGRFEDEGWRVRKDGTHILGQRRDHAHCAGRRHPARLRQGDSRPHPAKSHEERISRLTSELQQRVVDLDLANRELAQRNAENESFVYSVSHDLRAPLVNLQGFSQELALSERRARGRCWQRRASPTVSATNARGCSNGEMQESIGFIRNSVRHLGSIIDGLLRLSRVGRIEYESVPVDVGAVVRDMLASMHTTIDAVGAQIEVGRCR